MVNEGLDGDAGSFETCLADVICTTRALQAAVIPAQAGIHSNTQVMSRQYHVYILASKPNGTLYIGVTNSIARRVWQHRQGLVEGFTKKYGVDKLVYCEAFARPQEAIQREKRLKKWNRAWKIQLIESTYPAWKDLYETVMDMP
jgi:putative endonuclease